MPYFIRWRSLITLLAVLALPVPVAVAAHTQVPRVPWLKGLSWAAIQARAENADQPILIDFTASWCGPCKLLDVMVFTEGSVIRELADVVTIQVDIDEPAYQALNAQFDVEVVPTVVWCDRQGVERDRFTGYLSSAQFLDLVQTWRQNRSRDLVLSERQNASPEDPQVLLDLAQQHAERGHDRQADVLYRRLINLRFGTEPRAVARGMLGLAEMERRHDGWDRARALAEQVVAMYATAGPAADGRDELMLETALFQEAIGDTVGMLATFRTLAEWDDRNYLALHGYARAAVAAGRDLVPATRAALRAVVYSYDDPEVISTLAACYYWRGLYARAVRWQKKAVAGAPESRRYQHQLVKYEAALAADPHHMKGAPRR